MASEYITLWQNPKQHIMANMYSGGEKYNVGYDTLNNKYYGQHKKDDLLSGLQKEIDKYTKHIQDGGYQNGDWHSIFNPFRRLSPQELKDTQANVDRLTKYYSGIDSNYEEFASFDQSYKEYQQDWDNLFTRNYNNGIQKEKNAEVERQNALTEIRNKKVLNENMLNEAKAKETSGVSTGSGGIPKKVKPKEIIGTGISSQAERLADTLLGGTGLGL